MLYFSDTSTKRGIVQEYEKECGFEYGDVSGSTDKLATLVAGVNLALDEFVRLAISSEGTWQFDDSNQTDYPIITTNLVSGQRDYTFITDQLGNLILDIYQVDVANSTGLFNTIQPVDVSHRTQSPQDTYGAASGLLYTGSLDNFTNGQNATGTPNKYDKLANGIFLDPIPNYNYTNGLKVYVNREGSYFTASDTTKKPGVPGPFHRYFVLKPALDYARRNNTSNYQTLQAELIKMEGDEERGIVGSIQRYFSRRTQDERPRLTPAHQDNH